MSTPRILRRRNVCAALCRFAAVALVSMAGIANGGSPQLRAAAAVGPGTTQQPPVTPDAPRQEQVQAQLFLPLMEGAPRDARPQPSAAVGALAEAAAGRTYLPLAVTKGIQLTTENYPVGYWTASSIKVFGGRVTVTRSPSAACCGSGSTANSLLDRLLAWSRKALTTAWRAYACSPPLRVNRGHAT